MSRFVLDTSVVLAILQVERGVEKFSEEPELLNQAVMSTVNMAEAQGTLLRKGMSSEDAWFAIQSVVSDPVALDEEQAKLAGNLLPQTRALGLSLGDRVCLALAITLRAPVYTTDRQWAKLKLGIPIHLIR